MAGRKGRSVRGRRIAAREVVLRIALALGGAGAAVLVAEAAVRAFDIGAAPTPRRIVIAGQSREWCCGPETWVGSVHRYRPNTTFQHCYSGGSLGDFDRDGCVSYRINAIGYRGRDFTIAKPPGVYRVVTIGDSFTFGEGTAEPYIYPVVLENALQMRLGTARRVEVIDLGVSGDDTAAEAVNYRDFARSLGADWVVLQWTTNDFPSASVQKDHIRLIGAEYRSVIGSADEYPWSRLLSILARRRRLRAISDALVATTREEAESGRASFEDLARLARMAADDGSRFTVLVFPELIRFDAYPYTAIVDGLVDFCRARHIEVINLLPALAEHRASTLWVHETDHHPNRRAHAIAAEELARASR